MEFATVVNGVVTNLLILGGAAESGPGGGELLVCVDCVIPRPAIGWLFDGAVFSPPATTVAQRPPLSKVTILSRITPAEWHGFTTSTDSNAIYALAVFNAASEVRADDQLTQKLFGSLEQLGILAPGRAAEILA